MKARTTLLAAGATLALAAFPATAAENADRPILLAQAEAPATDATATDPVAVAEKAVEDARAALRQALASGDGIEQARENLRLALAALDAARTAAGQPPAPPQPEDQTQPPAQDQTPPLPQGETPPPVENQAPPPPEQTPPPPEQPPPPAQEQVQPPVQEQTPPATEQTQPPVTPDQPPKKFKKPPMKPTGEQPPPPADQTVTPPVTDQPPPVTDQPPPVTDQPPPSTEQPAPVTDQAAPPAEPKIDLPPPAAEPPPPPPPPEAKEGKFDLSKFKERPKFGEAPKDEAATPPPVLQQSEQSVKEGATIAAPDGRVIVKDQGQVTVLHDDVSRLRQRGDKVDQRPSDNDTETTTVTRPDGTQIVTVRDRSGNIIQRYRKLPDGTVQVMIGQVEQPGFVGRIFGRGPQMAPPRPRQPSLRLNLGPLQVQIPQDQYIVDMSQADEQQLQAALMAPPVEQVERPYSLEEIRRNGRLRDKVRRIDFDTITFETGQAIIDDTQVPKMQAIGEAIRAIVDEDPTQVFLIEGHTDAVGSDLYNLALSDRRAETVAEVLSYYFDIPPENLITQGYGEQFLKVPTVAAERENRRVAFRNISPLLQTAGQ